MGGHRAVRIGDAEEQAGRRATRPPLVASPDSGRVGTVTTATNVIDVLRSHFASHGEGVAAAYLFRLVRPLKAPELAEQARASLA